MDGTARKISRVIEPQGVVEGAGVRLKRSIGTRALDYLDPFLLLDHFQSKNPADYQAGFPLHPHRGIETVTYLLAGAVRHRDSVGNAGEIGAGDLQWMSAGRGIMHEEMPQVRPEGVAGFQLWVNLPAKQKMSAPRYQNIHAAEIPELRRDSGATVRVIAGTVDGVSGPITGIVAEPTYLDVSLAGGGTFAQPIPRGHSAFAYVFEGEARVGAGDGKIVAAPKLVVWGDGDSIEVRAEKTPARFLLVSGQPLNETIARYGPFVMNTQEEIQQTLRELQQGTFAR
ncbi:MAG TPA: pirin family protein [Candidatus Saccharimonadales bacterium]|nr:pirin family protein [Candidatus Saccharimonadales bacterium]